MSDREAVGAAYRKLHPRAFYRRTGEWIRGGLPGGMGDGRRAAERSYPKLDGEDVNVEALLASYCDDLRNALAATLTGDHRKAVRLLEHARETETGVLPELHMTPSQWDEYKMAMARAAAEDGSAREFRAVQCANDFCGRWVERTKDDPVMQGRCRNCHEYRRDHGGQERPKELCAAELEREMVKRAS